MPTTDFWFKSCYRIFSEVCWECCYTWSERFISTLYPWIERLRIGSLENVMGPYSDKVDALAAVYFHAGNLRIRKTIPPTSRLLSFSCFQAFFISITFYSFVIKKNHVSSNFICWYLAINDLHCCDTHRNTFRSQHTSILAISKLTSHQEFYLQAASLKLWQDSWYP